MVCPDERNPTKIELGSSPRSKLLAALLVGVFLITLSPFAEASSYRYDPELAAQLLEEAGVSSAATQQVLDYLDARDQAYQGLQASFSASAPFAYLVELEKRERTYQRMINADNAADVSAGALTIVKPLRLDSVVDPLDALSSERHSVYASIFAQTGDPVTIAQLAIFDSGIAGLVSLATVTGQPSLIQDYLSQGISSRAFVAQLEAGATPGLLEHTIASRVVLEQTLLDEYEAFASTLSATLGSGARAYFDFLDTQAQTLIDAAQSTSVHHLEAILDGTDYERDLAAALVTGGSTETFSGHFAYLGKRRNAYGAVAGELGGEAATDDLFESIEYELEPWEVQAKADEAAIRNDPHLKDMDTTDHAVGTVLQAVVDLGYSQFDPFAGMSVEEAFAAFNEDVEEISALVADVDENTSDDTMKELKKRLREIKEIKKLLKGLKKLMKDEMSEEDYKKLCKYIRIGCVLLRAACDILDILCEDKADKQPVLKISPATHYGFRMN